MNDMTIDLMTKEKNKATIIELFRRVVKGNKSNTLQANTKHAGKEGHWLELQMGLLLNASNSPDFLGFEMKNGTTAKTTFGDWSADYYIFRDAQAGINRDKFLEIFGKPNQAKKGRYSWSGEPCPKIGKFSRFGQTLVIDSQNNIVVIYCFALDKRLDKNTIVPPALQQDKLVLVKWNEESLRKKVENKFNQNGWFKCMKNKEGVYTSIVFGDPISFEYWLYMVRSGDVFFDSGMYAGNNRPYSMWRANNKLWASLVTSTYT